DDGDGDEVLPKKGGAAAAYSGTGKYGTRGARQAGTGAGAEELKSLDSPSRRSAVGWSPSSATAAAAAAAFSPVKSPLGRRGAGDAEEEEDEDMDALDAMRDMEGSPVRPNAAAAAAATSILSPPPAAPSAPAPTSSSSTTAALPANRLNSFRSRLAALFARGGSLSEEDYATLGNVLEGVNRGVPARDMFSDAEAREALRIMGEADEIMFSDDVVYKI
ncbi:hypothetical protein CF326_g8091, partial [Tilletia indica]